jgi:hypothetical protein
VLLAADLADRLIEVAEDHRALAIACIDQKRSTEAWHDATVAAALVAVAETIRALDESEAA